MLSSAEHEKVFVISGPESVQNFRAYTLINFVLKHTCTLFDRSEEIRLRGYKTFFMVV